MKIIYCLVLIFLSIFSFNSNVESNSVLMKTDTLKQNNGKILTYPKFNKSLIILQRDQTVYSDNYKKRIRRPNHLKNQRLLYVFFIRTFPFNDAFYNRVVSFGQFQSLNEEFFASS